MKNSIHLSDFNFRYVGYGHYKVTYTNPATGKPWTETTTDLPLINATKNAGGKPKKKDLIELKKMCKK